LLLAAGADVNARNDMDMTPLHITHHASLVEILVAHGADVNARAQHGWTPLHVQAGESEDSGASEPIAALLDAGADPSLRDAAGETPLAIALAREEPEKIALLRAHGATESPGPEADGHRGRDGPEAPGGAPVNVETLVVRPARRPSASLSLADWGVIAAAVVLDLSLILPWVSLGGLVIRPAELLGAWALVGLLALIVLATVMAGRWSYTRWLGLVPLVCGGLLLGVLVGVAGAVLALNPLLARV